MGINNIISPDFKGYIDPVVYNILKDVDSPIPLVPITRIDNFKFNEYLYGLKEYILVDFIEYGWDWDMKETHLFGTNTYPNFRHLLEGDEWTLFDIFVSGNSPKIYFKRELLSKDFKNNIKPIEYPALNKIPKPDTREQFNNRTVQVFNQWGLSHERRKIIHGNIWLDAGKYGYVVCDNISILPSFLKEETNPKKWITQNIPWYARYSMEDIIEINGMSKLSCSWAGAGRKCFRHTESTVNSTMITWHDDIEWSYPWIDNFNCIKCEEGKEIERIVEALDNPNLYDIYRKGVEQCKKYYLPDYITNYIEPLINNL